MADQSIKTTKVHCKISDKPVSVELEIITNDVSHITLAAQSELDAYKAAYIYRFSHIKLEYSKSLEKYLLVVYKKGYEPK